MIISRMGFYESWFAKTKRVVIGILLLSIMVILTFAHLIISVYNP